MPRLEAHRIKPKLDDLILSCVIALGLLHESLRITAFFVFEFIARFGSLFELPDKQALSTILTCTCCKGYRSEKNDLANFVRIFSNIYAAI